MEVPQFAILNKSEVRYEDENCFRAVT